MLSARAERPKRSAEGTRRRILEAAEIEFAAKGFDGARLGNIARAADAQQALIHHYFDDKEGLYRAVLSGALDGLSAEGWDILKHVNSASIPPPANANANANAAKVDVAALVDAFVRSMIRFYASHGRILSILRHEAQAGSALAADVVERSTKPVFEAIVTLLETLQRRGEVRADFDARHLCISGLAMCAWPYEEQLFVGMILPGGVHDARFAEDRARDVVATILGRITRPTAAASRSAGTASAPSSPPDTPSSRPRPKRSRR